MVSSSLISLSPGYLRNHRLGTPLAVFTATLATMAVRRNTRLKREYLYRKSLEGKEREAFDRKEKIKAALQGSFVPAT